MKPEDQRIAIAEHLGWIYPGSTCLKHESWNRWIRPKGSTDRKVPDFLNDLNSMAEAEKTLSQDGYYEYNMVLHRAANAAGARTVIAYDRMTVSATAAQRAEAFLRTLGLWKDSSSLPEVSSVLSAGGETQP